jgi:hypothetical protein
MQPTGKAMIAQIQKDVVPVLRKLGFKGSYPSFRRIRPEQIDLLKFQFSTYGGRFVVEIGGFPPTGIEYHGTHVPPEQVTVSHLLGARIRLGETRDRSDHWFLYDDWNDPADTAREVVALLNTQAVAFWQTGDPHGVPIPENPNRIEVTSYAYCAVIFIGADSDFTFPALNSAIGATYAAGAIGAGQPDRITVTIGDFPLHIVLEEGPHIEAKSRDLADRLNDPDAAERIRGCTRRLTVWSSKSDREMDHFNDYLILTQDICASFRGLTACDCRSGTAM